MTNDDQDLNGAQALPSSDIGRAIGPSREKKKKGKISEAERQAKLDAAKIAMQTQYVKKINKAILENLRAANEARTFTMPERSASVMKEPVERIDSASPSDENFRIQVRMANALLAHFNGTEIQVAINESKTKIYIASNKDSINQDLSENIKSFDDVLDYCRRNLNDGAPASYGESQVSRLLRHSQKLLRSSVRDALANATITVPAADPVKGDGIHAEIRNIEAIANENNTESWRIAGTKVPCIACTITIKKINAELDVTLYLTPGYIGMLFLNQADAYTPLKIAIIPKRDDQIDKDYIKLESDRITNELLNLVAEHIPEDKGTMRNVEIRAGEESLQPSYPDSESDADEYTSGDIVRRKSDMRRPAMTR